MTYTNVYATFHEFLRFCTTYFTLCEPLAVVRLVILVAADFPVPCEHGLLAVFKVSPRRRTRKVFSLTTNVVLLDGFGDDGAGGVAALVVLTLGGDGPSYVAGRESQCDRCTRQQCRYSRRHDFVNLLFSHNGIFLARRSSAES